MERTLEEKIQAYKALASTIEELAEQKKALAAEILLLMPREVKTVHTPDCYARRIVRYSIKTSLQEARSFDAVILQEVIDRAKIKELYKSGKPIPGVSELQTLYVFMKHQAESAPDEIDSSS